MTGLRTLIEQGVSAAMDEHPKYFTPKGLEHGHAAITRKVMAALRGEGDQSSADESGAAPAAVQQPMLVDPQSREGMAYILLCQLGGATAPFRTGDGRISVPPSAAVASVWALADAPPRESWLFLTDRRQMGAWAEFFRETMPSIGRRDIVLRDRDAPGILMPWPWPPKADGSTYSTASEDAA